MFVEVGGYWDYRPVRVYVAPRWVVTYDNCNRPIRRYVSGYYETRRERYWVPSRPGYDRRERFDNRRTTRYDRDDRHDRRRERH